MLTFPFLFSLILAISLGFLAEQSSASNGLSDTTLFATTLSPTIFPTAKPSETSIASQDKGDESSSNRLLPLITLIILLPIGIIIFSCCQDLFDCQLCLGVIGGRRRRRAPVEMQTREYRLQSMKDDEMDAMEVGEAQDPVNPAGEDKNTQDPPDTAEQMLDSVESAVNHADKTADTANASHQYQEVTAQEGKNTSDEHSDEQAQSSLNEDDPQLHDRIQASSPHTTEPLQDESTNGI